MSSTRLTLWLGLAALIAGCRNEQPLAQEPSEPQLDDSWSTKSDDPSSPTPAWLSNGLIGIRIGTDGAGIDPPSGGFFSIDEFETTGEEKIRVLPNPFWVEVEVEGERLSPDFAELYERRLDFRDGLLTVQWTQTLPSGKRVVASNETALHPEARIVGQRWTISTSARAEVRLRTGFGLHPAGERIVAGERALNEGEFRIGSSGLRCRVLEYTTGPQASRTSNGAWGWTTTARLQAGQKLRFNRVATFGASPTGVPMEEARKRGRPVRWRPVGSQASFDPPVPPTFSELRDALQRRWAERWQTDIQIEGPEEDQQAVRSFLFYLRSAIHPEGGMSVSPFGLSNSTYNGHVFWDADVWVLPALALLDPQRARAIAEYRLNRERASMQGPFEPVSARLRHDDPVAAFKGLPMARFPWESSVSGTEVAPESHRRQIHVTGSVLWALDLASSLGLVPRERIEGPAGLGRRAALGMYSLSSPADGTRSFRQVMGPDEHGLCDDDLYTNLTATWLYNRYMRSELPTSGGGPWDLRPFALPRDSVTFLTYDRDDLRTYQQASAVLSIYPLQFPAAEKEARTMMERFEDKIIENGPAMSDSIHAIIWARLGETERAYERWRRSWQRYADLPLLLFSEKPNVERTYFVTGAAGCLQSVLYGFLGFRIDSRQDPDAAWSKRLIGGTFLTVRPNLPKAWKRVTFRDFAVLGKRYTLTVDHESVKVEESDK